ncbi:MAG: ABC transporter permease [Cyclobacteriaceae bacterium]|nr:ABC transporter permease [Cyclobacteriaceae bacterium]
MLRNYIIVSIRNILKHKFFSLVNITGLVIGMTCCLLIFMYIKDELSFDRFHQQSDNIYRVKLHGRIGGQEMLTLASNPVLADAMQKEIPGIEQALRADHRGDRVIRFEHKVFNENDVLAVDSNFFQVFSFELLYGDAKTVLTEPNSMVMTSALAEKYFGSVQEAMGKTLLVDTEKRAFKITGISAMPPANSHIQYNALLSWSSYPENDQGGWTRNSFYTYVVKNPNTNVADINAKLEDMVARNVGPELESGLGISFDKFREQGGIYSYHVFPMTDTHLHTNDLMHDMEAKGDIRYVYIFGAVGLFILVIACINFMNLSTARSAGRAKEVGLRKTLGSQRGQMIGQFLSESFLYSLVSVLIAVAASYLLLPFFNALSGKTLTLTVLREPAFMLTVLGLIIFVGLIAGSYPAFYLTSFNAVEVLKGKVRAGMKSKGVRSALVVVQFMVSTFLIATTIVVYNQLSFLQNKDMGLDHHHIINIAGMDRLGNSQRTFSEKVKTLAGVEQTSFTNNSFPGVNNTTLFMEKNSKAEKLMGKYWADWDHLETMSFTLKEGRFFSRDFKSDTLACVLNEAAVREFGWVDSALGKEILDFNGPEPTVINVVGVVKDFNFESLKDKVRPMIIRLGDEGNHLIARYSGDPQQVVASIETLWKQYAVDEPLEYAFLDQEFDRLFRAEMRLRDVFTVFSGLAILIACLGLFALAAFTTEQRTKEIGIRKTMGASSFSLAILLSKEFTILVIIAVVPAIALGWYVSNQWLNGFAYRIEIGPMVFVLSACIALGIAWLTVGYQSLKAAVSNPVNSLRHE